LQLVLENEGILNAKEKERDQRVAENNLKMNALKSEVESEHKCLEEKEIKIKEKLEKVMFLILNVLLLKLGSF
jgi:kinetochore protein Nuf2